MVVRRVVLVVAVIVALGHASRAEAQVAVVIEANRESLGLIPEPRDNCEPFFRTKVVAFTAPTQMLVSRVSLAMTISHPWVGHLSAWLVSPDGAWVTVFDRLGPGFRGSDSDLNGTYVFQDGAAGDLRAALSAAVVPPGAYPPGASQNNLSGGLMSPTFAGRLAQGQWALVLRDYCPGSFGPISGAQLTLVGTPAAFTTGASGSLGTIPDGPSMTPQAAGAPRDVTFTIAPGRGRVQKVRVSTALTHPRVGDLVARLIAPTGQSHVLFGYTGASDTGYGSSSRLAPSLPSPGGYQFQDGPGLLDWWMVAEVDDPLVFGVYNTSALGGPGSTGTVTSMDAAFAGVPSHGVWTLRLTDGAAGAVGSIAGASLYLETDATPSTFADGFATSYLAPLRVAAPGLLANDTDNLGGAVSAALVTGPSRGTVTLAASGAFTYTPAVGFAGTDTFTYRATNTTGPGNVATVSITVAAPTTVQPPTAFRVSSMTGHQVTLRWTPPAVGPAPTDFVIEGGVAPGQVLGGFAAGGPVPILTTSLPTGAFYLRVHAVDASGRRSAPSNEIPVFVNTPAVPSAPASLTGTVNGNAFGLSWRNTFAGGVPTSLQLTVSGAAVATLPVPLGETFSFAGVPAGTYTFRVGAVNPTGTSVESPPITLTFPNGCTGVPAPPPDFLAYVVGSVVHLAWDPPTTGASASSYVLHVGGSFTGVFPLATRNFSSPAPSGTYSLSLSAVNACGASAQTAPQTVFVP